MIKRNIEEVVQAVIGDKVISIEKLHLTGGIIYTYSSGLREKVQPHGDGIGGRKNCIAAGHRDCHLRKAAFKTGVFGKVGFSWKAALVIRKYDADGIVPERHTCSSCACTVGTSAKCVGFGSGCW